MNDSKVVLDVRNMRDPTEEELRQQAQGLVHQKLLDRNRSEVRRFVRLVRKLIKRNQTHLETVIIHEKDQSCCFKERWPETSKKLMKELGGKFNV